MRTGAGSGERIMRTVNSFWIGRLGCSILAAGLGLAAAGSVGAQGDPLVEAAQTLMRDAQSRGSWTNPLMPAATGELPVGSADQVLMAQVRSYTRELFDRGGWINPHAPAPGYDGGNVLLAVSPGEGVGSGG